MFLKYPNKNKINKVFPKARVYNTLRLVLKMVQAKEK